MYDDAEVQYARAELSKKLYKTAISQMGTVDYELHILQISPLEND